MVPIVGSRLLNRKRGPEGPQKRRSRGLFAVATVTFVSVGRQNYQATIDGESPKFDAEAEAFFVRKGGADFGPLLLRFAVALVLFDGEDVKTWIDDFLKIVVGIFALLLAVPCRAGGRKRLRM